MIKNPDEALSLLESLPKYDVKPGLSRINYLLESLNNPEENFASIHIGGSNGKGSVLALLSGVLSRKYRVGEFVSPPLVSFSDRIKVDGEGIEGSSLVEGVTHLEGPLEELRERGDPPSLFEAATALGAWYFQEKDIDLALMETGLGGRYDATNPVGRPLLTTVTSVDLEHQNLLGQTLEEIAGELAGLAKPGRPLVIGPSGESTEGVFQTECRKKECEVFFADREVNLELLEFDWEGSRFAVKDSPIDHLVGGKVEIGLPGSYQKNNLSTALSSLAHLNNTDFSVEPGEITSGLKEAKWPGRFQLLRRDPHFLVDGAHNEAASAVLAKELKRYGELRPENHDKFLVFSALKDKNLGGMLGKLGNVSDRTYLTELDHRRGVPLGGLETAASQLDLDYRLVSEPREAFKIVKEEAKPEDLICVTGSLYLVREAILSDIRR